MWEKSNKRGTGIITLEDSVSIKMFRGFLKPCSKGICLTEILPLALAYVIHYVRRLVNDIGRWLPV